VTTQAASAVDPNRLDIQINIIAHCCEQLGIDWALFLQSKTMPSCNSVAPVPHEICLPDSWPRSFRDLIPVTAEDSG
jgi:hypothetical protein